MNIPKEVEQFKHVASEFCQWAEHTPQTDDNELYHALKYAASLYHMALVMPDAECDDHYIPPELEKTDCHHIYERFGCLPFQYYFEIFSPVTEEPEEPVTGDLADDFLDMYVDVKSGLLLYEKGQIHNAVFHWKFAFGIHWGSHATSALRAMHRYWATVK